MAYLQEWYAELAVRLTALDAPAEGLSAEVHRAALMLQAAIARHASSGLATESTDVLIRSLRAEVLSLQTLVEELRGQRARDLQLLADARALLMRKDEQLQSCHKSELALRSALAVAQDRRRRQLTSAGAIRRKRAKASPRRAGPPSKAKARVVPKPKSRRPRMPIGRRVGSALRRHSRRPGTPTRRRVRAK